MKTKEKRYFVSNAYRTCFSFNDKSYVAVSTERDKIVPGTIKMLDRHQGLNWDMPCLSFIDDRGVEQVKTFIQGATSYKYSIIGLLSEMTEEQCQKIAKVNPHTSPMSYYGNGKRVFKSAKKALNSFHIENYIILEYNAAAHKRSEEDKALEATAKFMGAEEYYYVTDGMFSKKEYLISDVWIFPDNPRKKEFSLWQYKSSWDWLLPVFHKIRKDFKKNLYVPRDINKAFDKVSEFLIKENV